VSLFRRPSYELFIRTHQALAALAAYSIWRHLPSEKAFPRAYLYISAGLFLFMCLAQGYMVIRRNGVFRYRGAQAHITHEHGAVRVRVLFSGPHGKSIPMDDCENILMVASWFWSTIMPVESAEVARHPYRCRITWMVLDMRGLMAARPHAGSISIL
jgi:hypothetical protein